MPKEDQVVFYSKCIEGNSVSTYLLKNGTLDLTLSGPVDADWDGLCMFSCDVNTEFDLALDSEFIDLGHCKSDHRH